MLEQPASSSTIAYPDDAPVSKVNSITRPARCFPRGAQSLWSRLATVVDPIGTLEAPDVLERRWERWSSYLGGDGLDRILARCSIAGVEPTAVEAAMAEAARTRAGTKSEPPVHLRFSSPSGRTRVRSKIPCPFPEILQPIVDRALVRLEHTLAPEVKSMLVPGALESTASALLQKLGTIAHHALLHEFHLHRADRHSVETLFAQVTGRPEVHVYDSFVRSVVMEGGAAFYCKYPVIARLFATVVDAWHTYVVELLFRFQRDREELERVLSIPNDARIELLECSRSDPHNGNKTVAILYLEGDVRVVYKPRSVELESGFMRVLTHLNSSSSEPLYRVFKVVSRGDYGWCEFVQHSSIAGQSAAESFYHRMGALLAVLHAFRATDCHSENLISSEGFPVMVDLETLFQPNLDIYGPLGADEGKQMDVYSSVIRVGLLPMSRARSTEQDISVVGSILEKPIARIRDYEHGGSALMDLRDIEVSIGNEGCKPTDEPIEAQIIADRITRGFSDGYNLLLKERCNLLRLPDLLPSMKKLSCRFVARPTRAYGWLMQRGLEAAIVENGIDRSLEFERLYRACFEGRRPDVWFPIAEAEQKALEQLDVPYFTVRLTSRAIWSGKKRVIDHVLDCSPWQLVKKRIFSMCEEDRKHQMRVIQLSFAQRSVPAKEFPRPIVRTDGRYLERNRILAGAEGLAESIIEASRSYPASGPAWMGLKPTGELGLYRLNPAGPGLYEGSAGIGLFFAALYSIERDPMYRNWAMKVLEAAARNACVQKGREFLSYDLSEGVAGTAYALHRVARLLDAPALRRYALDLALSIPDEAIRSCSNVDVFGGVAGMALALEVISRDIPLPKLFKKMRLAADVILAREEHLSANSSAWRTLDDAPLPGFAHGSAGIAYAVARVGLRLREPRYVEAARRGMRNEARLYREDLANWEDLRTPSGGAPLVCSWCHGAIGIGLAQLGLDISTQDERDRTEARMWGVIDRTVAEGALHDSLCCGVTGALEVFARRPGERKGSKADLIAYLCDTERYRFLQCNEADPFLPGLFNGAAGVGYQLLRLLEPSKIPSVLLFE